MSPTLNPATACAAAWLRVTARYFGRPTGDPAVGQAAEVRDRTPTLRPFLFETRKVNAHHGGLAPVAFGAGESTTVAGAEATAAPVTMICPIMNGCGVQV